jgi:hypothetical protein
MLFFTLKIRMGMQNQAGGAAKVGARCTQLVYRTAISASIYKRTNFCAISPPHAPLETRAHTRIDIYIRAGNAHNVLN